MRLFRILCARTKFWDRYVERVKSQPSSRTTNDFIRKTREFKQKEFYYDENRPWTDNFKNNNLPGNRVKRVFVEPLDQWPIFKGDRVEIMVGKDKGKQGLVNAIIKERNWVFVEGLNCEVKVEQDIKNFPPSCTKKEKPLLVTRDVKLVDPSDELATDMEWRYTEDGDQVRVSTRTGRIIPRPYGATEVDHFVIPQVYVENDVKDTKEKDVHDITFEPKLCVFEDEINAEMGIVDDKKPVKTYYY